ncbi:MAG: hypothetical protein ACQCN5_04975 [Candidatus Bathyarchaeia archaeon]
MSQKMLVPSRDLEQLKNLVGEWSVGVALKIPNYKTLTGCGTLIAKILDSNLGISTQMDLHVEESEDYFEDALWSFDRDSGKIRVFSLTSRGDVHDHVGGWIDDKHLKVKWVGRYEGKPASEEITFNWISKNEIRIFETETLQDQPDVHIEYVLKRKTRK